MKENENNMLEQYDIDVKGTRRIRGAVLCDTSQGIFLLKEVKGMQKRIPMLHKLCIHLEKSGVERIDKIIGNKEGELVSTSEEGTKYIVKKWYEGKECDIRKESDILESTQNLARIHQVLRGSIEFGEEVENTGVAEEDLRQEYYRHNREMKKVRTFMRGKVGKGDFELAFLKHFDTMYEWAEEASARLLKSSYQELLEQSKEEKTIVHGEYNYHNVLISPRGTATTNFDRFHEGIQETDFYYFLRKTMEKNHWNTVLGDKMLNSYNAQKPLGDKEMEYLAISLSYPEKFWKSANSYYRSSKAWIPMKSVEKLEMAIRQTEEKRHFLETVFSFYL